MDAAEEARPTAETPVILHHGERVLADALDSLRRLTPEGWDHFYSAAMKAGWHTADLGRIREARLLSMRAGGRMAPPRERPNDHEHCDWPSCACWCSGGRGTKPHPEGGHHQHWGPNTASGAGDGYPTLGGGR